MDRVIEVAAKLQDGVVTPAMDRAELVERVMERAELVLLKDVFDDGMLTSLRRAVHAWGQAVPAAEVDDFRGNYHRRRAMVSRLQQAPHVFHDYNFNAIGQAPDALAPALLELFEPLRRLYNGLTGYETAFAIPESGPYVHPQLIQYPSGGGFFARHWHNLSPQKLGFIVSLSKRGRDYRNGGTQFEIDGEIVDMEARHGIGDLLIWRYDHHHWVTQSDLQDKFDWDSEGGRWVATFAYFDPF